MYAVYQKTSLQVFAAALDQLMVITAALTLVGVALAFLLRSGPARRAPTAARRPAPRTAPMGGFSRNS